MIDFYEFLINQEKVTAIDEIFLYENEKPKLFTLKNRYMIEDKYLLFFTRNKKNRGIWFEILLSNENIEKLKKSEITIYDCFKKYAKAQGFIQVSIVDFDKSSILGHYFMSEIEDYLLPNKEITLKTLGYKYNKENIKNFNEIGDNMNE